MKVPKESVKVILTENCLSIWIENGICLDRSSDRCYQFFRRSGKDIFMEIDIENKRQRTNDYE